MGRGDVACYKVPVSMTEGPKADGLGARRDLGAGFRPDDPSRVRERPTLELPERGVPLAARGDRWVSWVIKSSSLSFLENPPFSVFFPLRRHTYKAAATASGTAHAAGMTMHGMQLELSSP
eukprot:gene10162-17412_t